MASARAPLAATRRTHCRSDVGSSAGHVHLCACHPSPVTCHPSCVTRQFRCGAGAFLIPYGVLLLACGIPLFGLEVALAQYSRASPVAVFDAVPLLRGASPPLPAPLRSSPPALRRGRRRPRSLVLCLRLRSCYADLTLLVCTDYGHGCSNPPFNPNVTDNQFNNMFNHFNAYLLSYNLLTIYIIS